MNIIGKVTQYFMDELLNGSIGNSTNNELKYDNIADYIDSSDKFSFLSDIVPQRVSYNEACNKLSLSTEKKQGKQESGKEEV